MSKKLEAWIKFIAYFLFTVICTLIINHYFGSTYGFTAQIAFCLGYIWPSLIDYILVCINCRILEKQLHKKFNTIMNDTHRDILGAVKLYEEEHGGLGMPSDKMDIMQHYMQKYRDSIQQP